MTNKETPTRRNIGGGLSIPAAAEELRAAGVRVSEYTLRGAVNRKEVITVTINGLRRIPPSEIKRLRETFFPASA